MKDTGVLTDVRAQIILTYALCGFSNIASIGIQVGGIGALAPNQRATLAQLGVKALIGGSIACFLTACVASMMI
jgi:concentrative nucleoside transporter, CNT family